MMLAMPSRFEFNPAREVHVAERVSVRLQFELSKHDRSNVSVPQSGSVTPGRVASRVSALS